MSEASYWFQEVPDEARFPRLEGERRFDAAVIGGGIAGVSAAYFLARAGVKTALLEMGNVATGDTGYTTGFVTHFLDSSDATLRAWDASEKGINLFRELIAEEHIACDWEEKSAVEFTRKDDTRAFQDQWNAFRFLHGFEYRQESDAAQSVGFSCRALWRTAGEGQVHIRKFLMPLARSAVRLGASVFEESEVVDIGPGAPIQLRTDRGTISADWLVVASGPPLRQFFPLAARGLATAITYVIHASFSGKKPFPHALFWDDEEPYHYFRWVSDSDLIFGGEDRLMSQVRPEKNPHTALESYLRELAGEAEFSLINRWQGTIFSTPDVLPYMAPHPAYGERIIFLTGWGGNGMAHGLLGGSVAADIVQKKENPYQELFSFERK